MQDEFLLRSGLSNLFTSAETWIAVAYVAGMFIVLAFRPQQVGEPSSFRLSYLLFAAYLIVPSAISGSLWLTALDSGQGVTKAVFGNSGTLAMAVFQLSSLIGKALLALSIYFALRSMTRSRTPGFPMPNRPEIRD
jgi:hypothetical protein